MDDFLANMKRAEKEEQEDLELWIESFLDEDVEEKLDKIVHDVASQMASDVNNGGVSEQVKFLIAYMGNSTKIKEFLERHLQ